MAFDSVEYSRVRHAERMETDPEYREKRRVYAQRANAARKKRREENAAEDEKWREYERERSKARAKDHKYVLEKRARERTYAADRLQKHPTLVRQQKRTAQQARRARKRNQFVENVNPIIVLVRDVGICGLCGEPVDPDFHIDHIVPLSRGGLHRYDNVQAAHPVCNLRKGSRV